MLRTSERRRAPAASGLSVGRFLAMLGVAFGYLLLLTTLFGVLTRVNQPLGTDWQSVGGQGSAAFGNPLHVLSLLLPLVSITPLLLLLLSTAPVTRRRLLGWALVTGSIATVASAVLNLVGLTVAGFRNMDVVLPSVIVVAVFGFYYVFTTLAVLLADLTVRASVRRDASGDVGAEPAPISGRRHP